MEMVLRAAGVYVALLLLFRVAGKRMLSNATTFDLVLTLIISECVQQALIVNDTSFTQAMVLVATLVGLDIALSVAKQRWPRVDRLLDGVPVTLVEDGRVREDRLARERVGRDDLASAARREGIEPEDIGTAVLEVGGDITVTPKKRE